MYHITISFSGLSILVDIKKKTMQFQIALSGRQVKLSCRFTGNNFLSGKNLLKLILESFQHSFELA